MAQACGSSKPVFATAPYAADASGVMRVALPERCVFASAAEACSLYVDHYRPRKTGPRFPVAVVGCCRHPLGRYTLYPLGHVPYGRAALVPCRPSGALLREPATAEPVWPATLFDAAVAAASGQRWPAHSPADDDRRRRTQDCRLRLTGQLVGVHPDLDGRTRERIATRLRVATLALRDAARCWGASWMARGAAILAVVRALPIDAGVLDRLLAAGAVTALWPSPQRWDPGRRTWVRGHSRRTERPVGGAAPSRAPPPTNSPAAR